MSDAPHPMIQSEFDLIQTYFAALGPHREDVDLGVGDDCALLRPPPNRLLAQTQDTLAEGVHFAVGADPEALGHKALAVNLSDLAAMGAEPAWFSLGLTLPQADTAWVAAFAHGMAVLARAHGVRLVGGDTTRGPRSISIHAQGFVAAGRELRRSRARPGDLVYVSGTLGDAALGLMQQQGEWDGGAQHAALAERLHRPEPRVLLGRRLGGVAHAAIDLSDGLAADLGHICTASGVGARFELGRLPLSAAGRAYLAVTGDWMPFIAGGDDYELCFTLDPALEREAAAICRAAGCVCRHVGEVVAGDGVHCIAPDGAELSLARGGYEHFSG